MRNNETQTSRVAHRSFYCVSSITVLTATGARFTHGRSFKKFTSGRPLVGRFRFTVSKTFPGDFVHTVIPHRRNVQRLGRDYRTPAEARVSAKDQLYTIKRDRRGGDGIATPRGIHPRFWPSWPDHRGCVPCASIAPFHVRGRRGRAPLAALLALGHAYALENDMMPLTCVARSRQRTPCFLARSAAVREASLWAILRAGPRPQACRADL
ncbi:hypothetical protein MRX96_019302 [Rhipicephalus microplus]